MSVAADPFRERPQARLRARLSVLGATFGVESTDVALLQLVRDAFAGLPRHRVAHCPQRLSVCLTATDHRSSWGASDEPPRAVLNAGAGLLCATVDAGNYTIVDPAGARALVCVSPAMLRHRYHARYELIELAFLTLASRTQSLVPLHAACVGAGGRGILIVGSSGAGKSTLSLLALASGLQFVSDDSTFIALDGLCATGVPSYLHVQPSSLEFLTRGRLVTHIRGSPMIRRRSGAQKHEVDLRKLRGASLARAPLTLVATVMLSAREAQGRTALTELDRRTFLSRLRREQPYAVGAASWSEFERRIGALPAYELRRAGHPDAAVGVLQTLLRRAEEAR